MPWQLGNIKGASLVKRRRLSRSTIAVISSHPVFVYFFNQLIMQPSTYTRSTLALTVLLWLVTGAFAKSPVKPIHQFSLSKGDLDTQLRLLLGDLRLQLDQTKDPTHASEITSLHQVCIPATTGEKAACAARCRIDFASDNILMKNCINGCNANQDCKTVCGVHNTADYIKFGGAMKVLLVKNCTNVADSCPPCTLGNTRTPLVDDYDATSLLPVPLLGPVAIPVIGSISCDLTRFGIDLSVVTTPGFDESVTTDLTPDKGYHIAIKAFADAPTLKCHGAISADATLQNPLFDFYIKPVLTAPHRISWSVTAQFHAHVAYSLSSVHSLDSTVSTEVTSVITSAIASHQSQIDQALTAAVQSQIATRNNGDQVDDITTIVVSAESISFTYTPLCIAPDVCPCTTSCNGLHLCDPNYWTSPTSTGITCPPGSPCLANGTCCTPVCRASGCGDNGCGGSCGICPAGKVCNARTKTCSPCDEGSCVHPCLRTACGTWCGTCKIGFACQEGGCVDDRGPPRGGRR